MITAHTLIKNEENFIWYSVMSVIEHVDKILIWDTGSTDNTNEIVNELVKLYKNKIDYKEVGEVNKSEYTKVRQRMLDETGSGWVFILDGDEIWWEDSIRSLTDFIDKKGQVFESMVVPTINLVGDMFHFQEPTAGRYRFGKRKGHYNLRFINKNIPGLHVDSDYGEEGFFDFDNKPVQGRDLHKLKFIDAPYIHATHLTRSRNDKEVMQRTKKIKYEIGIEFPKDFYYPESFFKVRPTIVPNAWKDMGSAFKTIAFIETPLRKLKRRLV